MAELTQAPGASAPEEVDPVDVLAGDALRDLLAVPGVLRAGLALTMTGGRQLRFVSTDPDRLGPPLVWCLIDAYDALPLNLAVRTGEGVVVGSRADLVARFPDLAAVQHVDAPFRSVIALPLLSGGACLGGALVYRDGETAGPLPVELDDVAAGFAADLGDLYADRRRADADAAVPGPHETHAQLPPDASAPGVARRLVKDVLTAWGVDEETVADAQLCASELVTNVVIHVARASVISVERTDGGVVVMVDQPPVAGAVPAIAPGEAAGVGGRGLAVVDALAAAWGVETTGAGTRVWFRMDHPRS